MAFKFNKIKADLRSYPPYIIMGLHKVGKTTLFRDLVLFNYDDESKGVLISFKDEEGYLALDRLQVETAKVWNAFEDETTGERGFVQIVDDLVMNKDAYGIEMIGLDTLDKMVEVATDEVFNEHRRLKGVAPKSLNDALGGYGAGQKRVSELMQAQIARLREVGYAVFILAHTKIKDKTDPMTGEVYEQITNNLQSGFYNTFANTAQMIVNIVVERDIKDGRQLGEVRMMHFRDNGLVDAGSRFQEMPEKLELSAENFMKAFETGVKNSSCDGKVMTDKEIAKKRKEEDAVIKKQSKDVAEREANVKKEEANLTEKLEIIEQIKSRGISKATPEQSEAVKRYAKEKGISSITDTNVVTLDDLNHIASLMGL